MRFPAIDEIEEMAKDHDWWYMFSDDPKWYRRGEASIDGLVLKLIRLPFKDGKRIWDEYCPWSTPEKAQKNKMTFPVPFHLVFRNQPATYCIGSDRYPCTVVAMSKGGHKLSFTMDTTVDGEHIPNLKGTPREAFWSEKRQAYKCTSATVALGYKDEYRDPHF